MNKILIPLVIGIVILGTASLSFAKCGGDACGDTGKCCGEKTACCECAK